MHDKVIIHSLYKQHFNIGKTHLLTLLTLTLTLTYLNDKSAGGRSLQIILCFSLFGLIHHGTKKQTV